MLICHIFQPSIDYHCTIVLYISVEINDKSKLISNPNTMILSLIYVLPGYKYKTSAMLHVSL